MGLQWCLMGHHEVPVSEMEGKASCPKHGRRAKTAPDTVEEADEIDLETFKHRVANKLLSEPAVSASDWDLTRRFHEKLAGIKREVCDVCNERRFNFNIKAQDGISVCRRCRLDLKKNPGIGLFSSENLLDPGDVPLHLPTLSIAEELLIARVHVLMSYSRVKGVQYKYFGHIINFM